MAKPSTSTTKVMRQRMTVAIVLLVLISCYYQSDVEAVVPTKEASSFLHMELRPTSSLIEERRRTRKRSRRRLDGEDPFHDEFPAEWMHPYSRAVYATLRNPSLSNDEDEDDLDFVAKSQYEDFVQHRHLSRFERSFRQELGLNLHPNWKGNYSDPEDAFLELHDENILTKEIVRKHRGSQFGMQKGNNTRIEDRRHRSLLESLLGGKFDRYQAVPLSQGYGTHYVHLWVGTPIPQRQSVIVDTGSHFTGFPVAKECKKCGESHHTDPHFDPELSGSFRPLRCPSECVENYECEAPTPSLPSIQKFISPKANVTRTSFHSNYPRCKFTQAYTEGSSWTAYQARDIVYCGSGADLIEAVDPLDTKYAINFLFGCLKENTGLFMTQLADGIMGMSAHELTLPKQLYNEGKIESNMFAMCFRRELGTSKKGVTAGSMTLGGVSSTLDTSPMVYARNIRPYGWYTVYIEKVYVATQGGTQFLFDNPQESMEEIKKNHNIVSINSFDATQVNKDRGVIVDSGTTDTYISSSIRQEFVRIWKEATGMEYSNGAVYLTQGQLKKLPTLLIQFQASGTTSPTKSAKNDHLGQPPIEPSSKNTDGENAYTRPILGQVGYLDRNNWSDVLLAVPATSYMEYSTTLKLYTSRLFFTESRGGVIGANSMQGHNVLFDWQHGRIGFAQSSCAYDLIAGKNDNHGDFSSHHEELDDECMFVEEGRNPILFQTCLDSVISSKNKMAICEASDNPTNVEITGKEIWTLMVESPGKHPKSCEKAIEEWSASQDTINQLEPSETRCGRDGLCQEYRPCHIPCMKVLEHERNRVQKRDKKRDKSIAVYNEAVTIPHPVKERITTKQRPGTDEITVEESMVADICKPYLWSFCDDSCFQSRIVSSQAVIHSNGNYCIKSGQESRSCHVDACGRSDPCIVPFLVHGIFVLEGTGVSTSSWTPAVQEGFKERLFYAAHNMNVTKSKSKIFGPGDVNILVTRPWYGDDNESGEEDEDNHDTEALGVQLILQISISNPRAVKNQWDVRNRKLLQEVGVVWSNITSVFRGAKGASQCDPFDLYPLAINANLVANEILPSPAFLSMLVTSEEIDNDDKKNDSNDNVAPNTEFDTFLSKLESAKLTSSWTIGTQIYDDAINFLGPLAGTPLYPLLKVIHEVFIVLVVFWFAMCMLRSVRLCRVCIFRIIKRWKSGSFENRSNNDYGSDDGELLGLLRSAPGSNGNGNSSSNTPTLSEVELASASFSGSRTRKRLNSTSVPAWRKSKDGILVWRHPSFKC